MFFKVSWHGCHWFSSSCLFYSIHEKNTVSEINHFVKVCLCFLLFWFSRCTCVTLSLYALFLKSLFHSVGLFLFIGRIFQDSGKSFASEFKQACSNDGWGNLWLRRQPNLKGRGHTTDQPARRPTFLKGVNLSETVFVCLLVILPVAELHSSIWIVDLLSFYASFLSLCVCFISVSRSSVEQQPLHWDCRSLSLYIYS